jgi:hypothetical protein
LKRHIFPRTRPESELPSSKSPAGGLDRGDPGSRKILKERKERPWPQESLFSPPPLLEWPIAQAPAPAIILSIVEPKRLFALHAASSCRVAKTYQKQRTRRRLLFPGLRTRRSAPGAERLRRISARLPPCSCPSCTAGLAAPAPGPRLPAG